MRPLFRGGISVDAPRAFQFVRFSAVGAIGFLVDAGVLLIELHVFDVNPILGRLVSFSVAVLTTFELNRRWAFRRAGEKSYPAALTRYLGVQGLGFCCNFGIYTLLLFTLPLSYDAPLFCLAVASAVALVINYAGASLIVFRRDPRREDPAGGPSRR